ncbi:hypothetical protein [Leptospira harrisiae]|uniref:Uncharacterized protein n=1 Tax=Leptospira harrisiae TaxID=2023189 RepID=A0A2N0AFF0_9LEPT|nr:hypothetical protein [Leptospira harrisiae]PJZ82981.1 hypothetical protein CH364_18605 [Leptospira harrisiae]PKA06448.1 hypothetical protein CH366_19135 [Leptospira harrisiae]
MKLFLSSATGGVIFGIYIFYLLYASKNNLSYYGLSLPGAIANKCSSIQKFIPPEITKDKKKDILLSKSIIIPCGKNSFSFKQKYDSLVIETYLEFNNKKYKIQVAREDKLGYNQIDILGAIDNTIIMRIFTGDFVSELFGMNPSERFLFFNWKEGKFSIDRDLQ